MADKRHRRQTLRGRFLRITIPLIFISVIAVFSVIELIAHRSAITRLEQTINNIVRTQAAALANPLWNLDVDQIRLSLKAIVINPEILFVRVLGEDKQATEEIGQIPEGISEATLIRQQQTISFDAGAGSKIIGELELIATKEYVNALTQNRLIIAAIIAFVAVFIEVTAALYALRTIVGRPLERLLTSINNANVGQERQPVQWESNDELGQVIEAHNDLQDQQQDYENQLKLAKNTLEERVQERTVELVEARDQSVRAQTRLDDAIEAISDGFSLYDNTDRLVVSNTRYRKLLDADEKVIKPGVDFVTILQSAIDNGHLSDTGKSSDLWLKKRLERHKNPGESHVQKYANGNWIRISERRTQDQGIVAVYTDITELKIREEQLAKKTNQLEQLSAQLAKYLSPQIYESIFQGKKEVKIAAQRKKLTVFFSDIADFTEAADRLESEELTQLLNHYLTEMSRIALDHGATIDKYVGDAIVIFFGDPETCGVRDDALACVRMAVAMQVKMRELAQVWRNAGIARPLKCRMGIHTDFCTVGNFGSNDRLDYTIIGRGVNIASRLETHCDPDNVLISYETYAHVSDEFECSEAVDIKVKGLAYPVSAYKVVKQRHTDEIMGSDASDSWAKLATKDPAAMNNEERQSAIKILTESFGNTESEQTNKQTK